MTTIAAWTDGKTAWIGGDSGAYGEETVVLTADAKVWRIGNTLIGAAGGFRMAELARKSRLEDPTELRDHLFQFFVDGQLDLEYNDTDFLVVTLRGIHIIGNDFSVVRTRDNYAATGTGDAAALGALFALEAFGVPPRQRISQALKAAEAHTTSARPPFKILHL